MKKNNKNILITIAVTLGILTVLEAGARMVLSRIYNRGFDSSLIDKHKYGPTSGLKANANGTVWGKPFHTDELGGRRHERARKGKPKFFIIGDSVTEGVGVEDNETFANLISENLPVNMDMDVKNISMIGWSTADYRNAMDQLMAQDSSVNQVLLFYCLNDIYGKSGTADLPHMGKCGAAGEANGFLQNTIGIYKLLKLMIYQHSDKYFQYDEALYKDPARVNKAMGDIAHIEQLCESRGFSLVVILMPYRSQVEGKNPDDLQKALTVALAPLGVIIYDPLPALKKEKNPSALYLFGDEIHFSTAGHRVIAKVFTGK